MKISIDHVNPTKYRIIHRTTLQKDFLHVAIVDLWAERIINIISFVFVLRHFLNINQQPFSKVEIE